MTWLVGNKLVTITTSGGSRTQALLGLGHGGEDRRRNDQVTNNFNIWSPSGVHRPRRGRGQAALRGHNHGLVGGGLSPCLK